MKRFFQLPKFLAHLRIGTQLSLAFAVVLCLTAFSGAAAIFNLARVNQTSDELAHKWLPAVGHISNARIAVLEFRELELKHTRATDAGYRTEYEEKMKEANTVASTQMQAASALLLAPAEVKLAEQFKAKWMDYLAVNKRVLDLGKAEKTDDARDIADGAAKMALDDAIAALDATTALAFASSKTAAEHATVVYATSRTWTLGLVAAALCVGVLLSVLITRRLLAQLGGEPAAAAQVARAVAAGNLSTPIHVRAGDSTSLMAGLLHMQSSLSQVVATVRQGSERVAQASDEIAQGNQELSDRTDQQASALQQTAASMSQLGGTVRQNADNARQADELAKRATTVAKQGGDVVGRVVQTMHGINESSRRIGDIIGVIDGIAFQTNILALNAAVEAARAGEQGRGFAVVASEVRSLAQRSADAAREIKGLIATSVQRVEDGSKLVDEAGRTMTEVVSSIARVTSLMGDISAASREQSTGVNQVSGAVSQMDNATQQNAALVQQSAAAAGSLREQAQDLVNVVAAFKLSHAEVGEVAGLAA
jgi:methyl-accepting chemotaxis protein